MILAESLKCLTENKNSFSHWIEKHREVRGAILEGSEPTWFPQGVLYSHIRALSPEDRGECRASWNIHV